MAARADQPTFRALTREECDAVIARNHVGRIAYSRQNRVDIEPIHYVYEQGWIYGRTSPGAKLDTLAGSFHGIWPVVLEVDEVEGLFCWRSVVVHGNFHHLDPQGTPWEREEWGTGVEALRRLIPETFTDDDPVPFRNVMFAITAQEVSGREARRPQRVTIGRHGGPRPGCVDDGLARAGGRLRERRLHRVADLTRAGLAPGRG